MPIRMTDDAPDDSGDDDRRPSGGSGGGGGGWGGGGGGGGGGNGGGAFLILQLITFLFRHPVLGVIVLVIGGGLYLFSGSGGGSSNNNPAPNSPSPQVVSNNGGAGASKRGATLDPKAYDSTLVHEPLEPGSMPQRVSLLEFAPTRGDQGHQGSCVGWATSYGARTILRARQTGEQPDSIRFSPAFVFDQLAGGHCQDGTVLSHALTLMQRTGDVPLSEFPYDQHSCNAKPSSADLSNAQQFKIAGFDRLSNDASDYSINAQAIKQNLAQGAPVVIGMNVGGTFEDMDGKPVWHPTQEDWDFKGDWGGHAMAVIGYDDMLEGGAFQLMNSWGMKWGTQGTAYVRYKDFNHFVKEVYGLYPMGAQEAQGQDLKFGLVETGTNRHIAMKPVSAAVNTFRTASAMKIGTRFKVEFTNTKPVYTYLFGQETDGTSYVLFPYTEKHSPYCGIVGTRVFPRKQSLTADDKGTRDSVAVVISPKALDFKGLNTQITSAAGQSYGEKVTAALGAKLSHEAQLKAANGGVEMVSQGDGDKVNLVVLEFDKN